MTFCFNFLVRLPFRNQFEGRSTSYTFGRLAKRLNDAKAPFMVLPPLSLGIHPQVVYKSVPAHGDPYVFTVLDGYQSLPGEEALTNAPFDYRFTTFSVRSGRLTQAKLEFRSLWEPATNSTSGELDVFFK